VEQVDAGREAPLHETRLATSLRERRELLGLSQQGLADRVGVSRQAIHAVEVGRTVPATLLALRLARALACSVEDLFRLDDSGLAVRVGEDAEPGTRVAIGRVDGAWVAHPLAADGALAADGVLAGHGPGRTARPFGPVAGLERNLLVAGCAPLLGALAGRVSARFTDARLVWLAESSRRALDLLADGLVHVAGLHLTDRDAGLDNADRVAEAFPGRRMLVANLTRWRQGLVLPPGNPLGIRAAVDLLRPGVRAARREEGAGAHKLVVRLLGRAGVHDRLPEGPLAGGHADVARLVACGAADAGVAVEGVARALGLDFLPLVEERFDLVLPAERADHTPVRRLLATLDDPGFREDVDSLPGYDGGICGHVTTVGAG